MVFSGLVQSCSSLSQVRSSLPRSPLGLPGPFVTGTEKRKKSFVFETNGDEDFSTTSNFWLNTPGEGESSVLPRKSTRGESRAGPHGTNKRGTGTRREENELSKTETWRNWTGDWKTNKNPGDSRESGIRGEDEDSRNNNKRRLGGRLEHRRLENRE